MLTTGRPDGSSTSGSYIICIGAGASGLCLAYKLQRSFQKFTLTVCCMKLALACTMHEDGADERLRYTRKARRSQEPGLRTSIQGELQVHCLDDNSSSLTRTVLRGLDVLVIFRRTTTPIRLNPSLIGQVSMQALSRSRSTFRNFVVYMI